MMLEDGEIDEEDVETPTTLGLSSTDKSNPHSTETDHSSTNKRKTRESKQSKRKKHSKNNGYSKTAGHPTSTLDLIHSDDENSNHSDLVHQQQQQSQYDNLSYKNHFTQFNTNGHMGAQHQQQSTVPSTHQPPSLLGLPIQKPKSLMSSIPNTSNNKSKTPNAPKSLFDLFVAPPGTHGKSSLIDNGAETKFIDPIITEKENNKPAKFQKHHQQHHHHQQQHHQRNNNLTSSDLKRKSDDESESTAGMISIESIEKKMEKKRKYSELHKEKQKKQEAQAAAKPVREPIVCKFFQEGRCQKGAECPFSHNTVLNKKMEPCKFYLNGFCAKNENCLFMHGDFPCKFFHRKPSLNSSGLKSGCIHGDQCRFSHAPITDPLMQEALNKHVIETSYAGTNPDASNPDTNKPPGVSILGSPPRALQPMLAAKTALDSSDPRPPSLMSLMAVNLPSKPSEHKQNISPSPVQHPSSPPQSNLDLPQRTNQAPPQFKKTLLATPTNIAPSLLNNSLLPSVFGGTSAAQDVDERSVPVKLESKLPLLSTPPPVIPTGDIDERSMLQQMSDHSLPPTGVSLPTSLNAGQMGMLTNVDQGKTESLKQELILKIMKSIADEDSGNGDALSQLPKQTLTELLVKLLNDKDNLLGMDVIVNLLTTLGGPVVKQEAVGVVSGVKSELREFGEFGDDDERIHVGGGRTHNDSLNESSCNLQIDLNADKKREKNGVRRPDDDSDYDIDDEYDHEQDDDDDDKCLVIEGTLDKEMEYQLIELDVEPSSLWSEPPQTPEPTVFDQQDQECDPRIKYYQDKQNCMNIANYQLQLIQQNQQYLKQQEQQTTPTSPSYTTTAATTAAATTPTNVNSSTPPTTTTGTEPSTAVNDQKSSGLKNRIVDPRLKKNFVNNSASPTRSISPTSQDLFNLGSKSSQQIQNDLISIQTRQVSGSSSNSLLSALPDLQFPKDMKSSVFNGGPGGQSHNADTNTVKLSIEDYKRKLQKPVASATVSNALTNSTMSILSSLTTSSSNANSVEGTNGDMSSSLPSIPSYSVNLQAPQSLHELLRNFQSS